LNLNADGSKTNGAAAELDVEAPAAAAGGEANEKLNGIAVEEEENKVDEKVGKTGADEEDGVENDEEDVEDIVVEDMVGSGEKSVDWPVPT
jgi:predicted AAA+ superfamily ATPase